MRQNLSNLHQVPGFQALVLARTVSNFGNGMSPIALSFGVLSLPNATPSSLSLVTTSGMIPIVLFLLIGGVTADKYGKALVVGATDMILSISVAFGAYLFLTGHATVFILCVLAAFGGALNALWYPAFSGLMPEIVPDLQLQSANSIVGFGANIGFTAGATVGGIIVAALGPGWAIAIDALSFFIAGLLVFSLRGYARTTSSSSPDVSMISQLKDGWSEFISRQWIVVIVVAFAFTNMCFEGFLGVLAPVQMKESLNGARDMGTMLLFFGLGSILGVVIAMKIRPRFPLRIAMGVIPLLGIWMLALAIPSSHLIIYIAAFGGGIAIDLFFVLWLTTMQQNVPSESISRVGSYDALGSSLFAPLGLFLAGPLATWWGLRPTMLTAGIITIVFSLGTFLFPSVRNLQSVGQE